MSNDFRVASLQQLMPNDPGEKTHLLSYNSLSFFSPVGAQKNVAFLTPFLIAETTLPIRLLRISSSSPPQFFLVLHLLYFLSSELILPLLLLLPIALSLFQDLGLLVSANLLPPLSDRLQNMTTNQNLVPKVFLTIR